MSLVDPIRRTWRRLAEIGPLTKPMASVKERVEGALFQLDGSRRSELDRLYADCKTVRDYLTFANRVFGPHQLEREITGFLALAAEEKPRTVCEIGTANGGTTFLLGQSLQTTEIMIGVDLFIKRRPRLRHFARPGQKIVLLDGDSGAPDTLNQVRAALGGRELDLLFIDGDHSLAGVARDFQIFRPLVRDGGLVAFHDVVEDSFTRTGIRTPHWTGGVPKYWRALKGHYRHHEFVNSWDQDGLGIGAIRYDRTVTPPSIEGL
jgi:cephalosporin hydroxylase